MSSGIKSQYLARQVQLTSKTFRSCRLFLHPPLVSCDIVKSVAVWRSNATGCWGCKANVCLELDGCQVNEDPYCPSDQTYVMPRNRGHLGVGGWARAGGWPQTHIPKGLRQQILMLPSKWTVLDRHSSPSSSVQKS